MAAQLTSEESLELSDSHNVGECSSLTFGAGAPGRDSCIQELSHASSEIRLRIRACGDFFRSPRRKCIARSYPVTVRTLGSCQLASLSMVTSGRGSDTTKTKRWLNFAAVLGTQTRALMKQVPLLERAGIGALAGGLAGGFTNATLHPIDTVKTKLQTKGSSSVYKGPIDVVKKVLATQGVAGFYCGLPAALLGSTVSSSVYFGMYELGKGLLGGVSSCPGALVPPLSAAVGNIASSAILVPKEVIKQRMQAGAVGSAVEVMAQTLKLEGIPGLYAGYSAALLRNLPSNMLNFTAFEYAKAAWLTSSGKETLEPWQSILSGAGAGALSACLTTPLDVVKTRLMTQARQAVRAAGKSGTKAEAAARAKAIAAYTYHGVAATMNRIWVEEGARGLTRGMAPRVLYSACFSAVGFLSFETLRMVLLKARQEQSRAETGGERDHILGGELVGARRMSTEEISHTSLELQTLDREGVQRR